MAIPRDHDGTTPRAFAAATWAASSAPLWLLEAAADVGGRLQYWLQAERRRSYRANTRGLAFPVRSRPWHAFRNHALNVLELLRAARQDDLLERMTLRGREHVDGALAGRRGLVLVTFHSGNWELAGLMLSLLGYPLTTIAGEQLSAGWSQPVRKLKERAGIRVLAPDASIRRLYRDLAENRVVVLHIDGNLHSGGLAVPFLGRSFSVPRGPARLSRVMSAPLGFAYCRRSRAGRLEVIVEKSSPPVADVDAEVPATRALVARVEKCILEDPAQWCIFRRL